jgi:NADH-ubiquinone oxidoreductase chain 5
VYIKEDKFIDRFTVLVLLFVLSINMLIFLPHLIILLLGWDGLGIVSFILVIYYQNPKSLAAGIVTALTNRVGDVMLLLAIA